MNKRIQKRLVLKRNIKIWISKFCISIILFLMGMIFVKKNPSSKQWLTQKIFEESFPFQQMQVLYEKYFGNALSINKVISKTEPVFHESFSYESVEAYQNGARVKVENHLAIPALESGVVIYIGEKEDLGETIAIEQVDGVVTYYSHLHTVHKNLYDYVEKGEVLGEAFDDEVYLAFQKKGEYLNYQDYL